MALARCMQQRNRRCVRKPRKEAARRAPRIVEETVRLHTRNNARTASSSYSVVYDFQRIRSNHAQRANGQRRYAAHTRSLHRKRGKPSLQSMRSLRQAPAAAARRIQPRQPAAMPRSAVWTAQTRHHHASRRSANRERVQRMLYKRVHSITCVDRSALRVVVVQVKKKVAAEVTYSPSSQHEKVQPLRSLPHVRSSGTIIIAIRPRTVKGSRTSSRRHVGTREIRVRCSVSTKPPAQVRWGSAYGK
jgi:hypothetical protein